MSTNGDAPNADNQLDAWTATHLEILLRAATKVRVLRSWRGGMLTASQPSAFTATAAKVSKPPLRRCKTAFRHQSSSAFGRLMMVSQLAHGRKLLSCLVEISAFLAERFSTISLPEIFLLNVVASVAVGIVMVDRCFNRMPRRFLGHCIPPSNARNARNDDITKSERVYL